MKKSRRWRFNTIVFICLEGSRVFYEHWHQFYLAGDNMAPTAGGGGVGVMNHVKEQ